MWCCCKIVKNFTHVYCASNNSCFFQYKMSLFFIFLQHLISTLKNWNANYNFETLTKLTFISFYSFVFARFSINNKYVKLKSSDHAGLSRQSWRQTPSILQIFKETFWKRSNTKLFKLKAVKLFRLIFSLYIIW